MNEFLVLNEAELFEIEGGGKIDWGEVVKDSAVAGTAGLIGGAAVGAVTGTMVGGLGTIPGAAVGAVGGTVSGLVGGAVSSVLDQWLS